MKKSLKVSVASNIVCMSSCSHHTDHGCGIMYRAS